jgi:hypothetical protein
VSEKVVRDDLKETHLSEADTAETWDVIVTKTNSDQGGMGIMQKAAVAKL